MKAIKPYSQRVMGLVLRCDVPYAVRCKVCGFQRRIVSTDQLFWPPFWECKNGCKALGKTVQMEKTR